MKEELVRRKEKEIEKEDKNMKKILCMRERKIESKKKKESSQNTE